jgi:phosphoserine aminotransferase
VSDRCFNFSAGPAVLPEPVLERARDDLWNIGGSGAGVLEHSHRGGVFDRILEEAEADCLRLAGVASGYRVLFVAGGASPNFFMVPANFLPADATADYLNTGTWSKRAIGQAKRYGRVHVAGSSEDESFSYVPAPEATRWSQAPVYAHFTSNNTIFGTQFREEPTPPAGTWLACDASSDIFSRPIDVSRYGVLYAGAQKNLGPSGIAMVIAREDLLGEPVRDLPEMLRYATYAADDSRYNTPNVFGIYVIGQVLKWLLEQGGLAKMAERNERKARTLYETIDASDFYRGAARADSRSLMNVTFRLPSEELEAKLIAEAEANGMIGLKGHRSVGGLRASIYNAFPEEGCRALADLMRDFEARYG